MMRAIRGRGGSGWAMACACVLLLIFAAMNLTFGASNLSPLEIARNVLNGDVGSKGYLIFYHVRLPRTLAALMAGAALAAAGVLLQAALNNPLAAPGVIGVNAGAGLFALLAMTFFPARPALVSAFSFFGACVAALFVYLLAKRTGASRTTMVLSGVAVSSLLGACMDALVSLLPEAAVNRSAFAIGGFANATLSKLGFAFLPLALGLLVAFLFGRERALLALGDETAGGLGLRVARFRVVFLMAAALLAGSAVSFSGLLGFVGLMTPHAARLACGTDARAVLPLSMLLGMDLCLLCDLLSRTLCAPYELPVGILLSFLGVPFFLYLLYRQRGSESDVDA